MRGKELLTVFKEAFGEWRDDRAAVYASSLSFYTIFSLAPLAIIVTGVVGIIYGEAAARGELVARLGDQIGPQAARLVETAVINAAQGGRGVVATIIGTAVLLFGATTVVAQLQMALNTMWEVEPKPGEGIMSFVRARLLSLLLILATGVLVIASLVASAVLAAVGDYLSGITPGVSVLLRIGNFLLSLAVITVLFAAIFMYLPDARIRWKDVWVGALFTAVLFSIGRYLIGLYMGQTTLASTYGAAGSLVILLLWVFYSAQIVLFGAEFTHAYARHFGTEIRPGKHARQMHPGDHVGGAAPGTA